MAIDKITTPAVTDANITTDKVTDNAITLAKMASGTDGNIISYDTSGNPVAVATGSSGQVLTSAGAGAVPSFQAVASATNLPAFHAYNASSQTLANTTETQLVYSNELFDSNNAFTNNTFTVPSGQAGNYIITLRYILEGVFSSRMVLYLRQNSNNIMGMQSHHESTDNGVNLTTCVYLSAGNTMTARAYQDSGSSRTIVAGSIWTEFSGVKMIGS